MHLLSSNTFSGAENVACQIISLFKNDANCESVYCSPNGDIGSALKERGITFIPMAKMCKKEIKRVIDLYKPDIIHAHDRTASFLAASVFKNGIIIAHMHVNNNRGFKLLLKNILWLIRTPRFKHIFWVSQSSFTGYQFHTLLRKKSTVLYNVMNSDELLDKCFDGDSPNKYDVCFVGRLSYQKNPERLMAICNELVKNKNDIKIAIAGSGEYSSFVENFIESHNIGSNVSYLGYLNNPYPIISNSKILLLVSRFEGTPMVSIESQVLGVPIISTPVDGMRDVVCDGINGFLSDENDVICEKIIDIITHPVLRERLSRESLKMSTKFTDVVAYKNEISKAYFY